MQVPGHAICDGCSWFSADTDAANFLATPARVPCRSQSRPAGGRCTLSHVINGGTNRREINSIARSGGRD